MAEHSASGVHSAHSQLRLITIYYIIIKFNYNA